MYRHGAQLVAVVKIKARRVRLSVAAVQVVCQRVGRGRQGNFSAVCQFDLVRGRAMAVNGR